ncbi:MAG: threonine--tRNA ligase [Anaerolineae bacterium]|nr:threonine--tRNA ligase [Anaerolineae bacterium]NIN98603.1 threonine--tRNA ligase [Anaerolineae bacterium]NIQ81487.1 threonine--tRNA ligase [Anaerolineae bacterium]
MSENGLEALRHSTSHIMAEAVLHLFPGAKFGIGPSIEDGFYYDFDLPRPLTPEDLEVIETRMREIIKARYAFERREISRAEAEQVFSDQPYKLELIADMPEDEVISIYTQGEFTDLCRGPHVKDTGQVNTEAFKLLKVAGAYWRGDEQRPMLQRIYGTAWLSEEELESYLEKLAELEKRDHRRLGKELELYSVHEEAGAGLVHWHPKGGVIRTVIEDFWREEHYKAGYDLIYTPHIGRAQLWEDSGHLELYSELMYSPMEIEGQEYYIKPMNCPFHIMIYKNRLRSYRELPLRWAELGTVYRFERSGVLHGLMRVRGFTQDDAHIFCPPDEIDEELSRVLALSLFIWRSFGFDEYEIYLSTRPERHIGEPERWQQAEAALRYALEKEGLPYEVDEGAGAFYGPKIDISIKDALGRIWQCTTIQFDFNLPERFDMTFIGEDGKEARPYMVHRALLGSLERFFGILIEHHAGAFPVWLAPVQAVLIPITDRHVEYARQVETRLRATGLRTEVDARSERMQAKIRDAQLQKIPYMLVIGDREVESGAVAVRLRTEEDLGAKPVEEFIALVGEAIKEKRLD